MGRRITALALAVLAVSAGGAVVAPADDPPPARVVGLVESAETRLAQLDVTVIGPDEIVRELEAEDFAVRINFRQVTEFQLDRLCGPPAGPGDDERAGEPEPAVAAARAAPSYLFYFDQPQLTLAGRQRALDVARELVPELIAGGARAMIVSNAARLKVIEPFTGDVGALLDALERLEHDRTQWDTFADQEDRRVDEVTRVLNDTQEIQRAIALARVYQREERWRAERSMRRLELTLGRLFDLEAPKALIYFADTLRSNPGEHYLSFFGTALRRTESTLGAMQADTLTGRLPFDQLVNTASAQGIRLYTIEARGLVSHMDHSLVNPSAMAETGIASSSSRVRVRDAQSALRDLSGETGGHAFLNGVRATKVGSRILEDSSCVYLISFDPGDLREDVPLRVSVKLRREGARARVRGRLVLPSASARSVARMLHAFGTAGEVSDPLGLRVGLVPLSFREGAYDVLLQVGVPGTPLQSATWDLGSSLIRTEKVRTEASGRIRVGRPGVSVVLEQELRIKPGDYRVVSVAHEEGSGLVLSAQADFAWPAPGANGVSLGPIALLQPAAGAFLRDGETRPRGSLVLGAAVPADAGRPSALIGLVCRGRRLKEDLRIERVLTGRSEESFDPLTLTREEGRCVQVRDLLPEQGLAPGYYRYEIRVLRGAESLGEASREFFVAPPAG